MNHLYTNVQTCETLQWKKYYNYKSLCMELFLWIKRSIDKRHLITGSLLFFRLLSIPQLYAPEMSGMESH